MCVSSITECFFKVAEMVIFNMCGCNVLQSPVEAGLVLITGGRFVVQEDFTL